MSNTIFSLELVEQVTAELGITDLENATIGQSVAVAQRLIELTGTPFVRMDQGVPGLQPCKVGLEAEREALLTNVASIYPHPSGIVQLREATSRFVKAFVGVDVNPDCCVSTSGSVASSFAAFIACNQAKEGVDTVLFIDPGFPIQKSQLAVQGAKYESFDIFEFRGEKLKAKLESYLEKGNISSIIYSNPNNPAWICLTESELQIIGELATKYDVIILEDLAYFEMDNRRELGRPFEPPYQASVSRYTDNYIIMLSASKIFSYAGQRSAVMAISNKLFNRNFEALAKRYGGIGQFGSTLVNAILYMITSGTTHTTQYGYAAMLNGAVDGTIDFIGETSEYARRAKRMKEVFEANDFHVVYDYDLDEKIGDGFFFSVGYKDFESGRLMRELVYFGVSSISLTTTGSEQRGIRACASRMTDEAIDLLDERLKAFNSFHS
ncbi:MAG: pyridoxal phosphate-dependent aminotransferase [Rikenellaceae bacterium]